MTRFKTTSVRAKKAPATPKAKAGGFARHAMRVTTSSVKHDWRTPPSLIDLIAKVAGPIVLDPSASTDPAHQFASLNYCGTDPENDDGLEMMWRGLGVVYCNPPYGRSMHRWVKKAADEWTDEGSTYEESLEDHIFLLVPARPDTQWFQTELLPWVSALCFLRGRLKFSGHADAAPFPSLLAYFGAKPKRFRKVFRKHGWVTLHPGRTLTTKETP